MNDIAKKHGSVIPVQHWKRRIRSSAAMPVEHEADKKTFDAFPEATSILMENKVLKRQVKQLIEENDELLKNLNIKPETDLAPPQVQKIPIDIEINLIINGKKIVI